MAAGVQPTVLRSIAMYVLATAFFVTLDSLAKMLMKDALPPALVVWGRYAGSLAVIVLVMPFAGAARTMATRHLALQLARGALLVGATGCMFLAVRTLPVALSYAISYVSPLLVMIMAAWALKEDISPRQATGAVLGFIGVLIIIRPGFAEWQWAMLFPLGSAAFYALYQILTRVVGLHDNALTSLFYVTLGGTVLSTLALPWSYTPMPLTTWGLMGLLGILGTAGHFLLIWAYTGAPASVLSPFVYVQIVWAGLIDIFVFNISFNPVVVLGAVVVIGGGLLIIDSVQKGSHTDRNPT
jgi:drug/metabolite transporter (DMT)-like permease